VKHLARLPLLLLVLALPLGPCNPEPPDDEACIRVLETAICYPS